MSEEQQTESTAVDPAEGAAAPDQDVSPEMAALQKDRDELYDRLLRTTAEFENYRKRVDRERREQSDRAVAGLLEDVLLVMDDFERALASESGEDDAYRKGIELIYTNLQEVLSRRGVKAIEALGADFDPNIHQAVLREATEEHRDGEVIGEMRRGYMIGDRLLRPAMVKVAVRG